MNNKNYYISCIKICNFFYFLCIYVHKVLKTRKGGKTTMANVKIEEKLIAKNTKCRPGTVKPKKWIVIHETGNPSKGAGADSHATYLSNLAKKNDTYLSWHYTVDDKKIIRHIPDNEIAWHAGDGTTEGGGNMTGIAIEICINPESDFNVAMKNAESLTAELLKANKLNISAVKQHHDFSSYGKNCPQQIRDRGLWNDFLSGVKEYYSNLGIDTSSKASPKTTASTDSKAKFSVGDKVILNGPVYTDSYASKAGQKFTFKVCTVTKVADTSRPAPYLLNDGLGWAKENNISKSGQSSKTLSVGARVNVNGNLYTTSYAEKPVRAISGNYTVSKIIPNRKAGILLNGDYGWVKASDCTVI